MSKSFKALHYAEIEESFWSVLTYTDFILINVLDDQVEIQVEKGFVQTSDNTRVLRFKVGEYWFQVVDIRVLHFGASYTLRSIRYDADDDDDKSLLNETTAKNIKSPLNETITTGVAAEKKI